MRLRIAMPIKRRIDGAWTATLGRFRVTLALDQVSEQGAAFDWHAEGVKAREAVARLLGDRAA